MKFIKSMSKRTLALILALMMMLSSGIIGAVAANVELAPTGYDITAGKSVYFLDTASWGACQMYLWKDRYNTYYTLSKIANTNIYRYNFESKWEGYTGFKFRSNTSWSKQSSGDIKTNISDHSYFVGAGTTKYTTMDNMNGTAAVVTMISTDGGTTYKATSNASTYTTISGYNLAAGASSTTNKSAKTSSASSVSFEAAYGSNITYTATPGNATFKGFSETDSSTLPTMKSTDSSYTVTASAYNGDDNKTIYAYYILASNHKVTLKQATGGNATTSATTVEDGKTVTLTATPTTGYNFDKWTISGTYAESSTANLSSASLTITPKSDITVTPSYKQTYAVTVTVNNSAWGSAEADPTTVEHGGTSELTAEANRGYKFLYWEKSDGTQVTDNPYTISNITEAQSYTAVFEALPTYTLTINNDSHSGAVTVKVNGTSKTLSDGKLEGLLYGDELYIEIGSETYYYISSLKINDTEYAENSTYFPQNLWTFKYDKTVEEGNLIIDVVHTHNPYLYKETPSNGTLTLDYNVDNSYSYKVTDDITYTATANDEYYVSKVYTKDNDGNILKVYYQGNDASKNVVTGDLDPLVVDTTVCAEFTKKTYYKVTIIENGYTGSYTFGNLNAEADGSFRVESGSKVQLTASVPTNSTHYISAIDSKTYSEGTLNASVDYTITGPVTITINYTERPTYTVTVVNNDENMGSLNATTKTDLYMNAKFIIKPTAKYGFQFKGWNVVGPSTYVVAADGTITITVKGTETNKETTVTAKWEKKTNFTVTLKAPASMGWASGSGTDANLGDISLDTKANTATLNSAEVYAGTVLTFTANTWDDTYVFDKWDIQGNYTNATQNGSTLTLTANGEVTVTALYKQGSYKFYVLNASPYTNVYVKVNYYTYNWTKLTDTKVIDGNTYLVGTMAANTDWIQFASDGNGSNFWQIKNANGSLASVGNSMNLASSNKDNNNSYKGWGWITAGSTNAPITYELTGGVSLKLEDYGDGNHIGSVEIPSGKTSITVNPYGSDKKYWNFASTIDDNSANVTQGSATKDTAVTINLGSNSNGVKVDFSFNPVTKKLSWTVTQMKATVDITVNYGMNQNEADPHDGQDIAKTYYKVDGEIVYSFTEGNGHVAKIAEGEMVTVYTEIYASAYQNGKPIHRVEGWVLDGVEFIPASSNDGKTFYGTYKYTKDAEITPIFFHTDEWLTANNVSTVTVYAVLDTKDDTTPNHEIAEWQKGISSYTWFYKSGETTSKYCQFDTWTGQYMIPVGNNVFKTYVETKGASGSAYTGKGFYGLDISGITFTNVMKDTINTDDWVQAYDYYEFKSLIDDGRFNITYVLRNHNTKVNKDKKPSATISTTNYQWMNYIDYSGNIMDIYRNVTKSKSTTTPDNTLYIVREGPYNITGSADRNGNEARGEFYLYSNIYDASGNRIDRCLTYELVDPDSKFFEKLKEHEAEIQQTHPEFTYVGGNVQISYEAENNKKYDGKLQATRYDGEWYGDLTDTTKVDINVLVGFTEDNGNTNTVLDVSANKYGTATVNGKAEDEVTRGSYATLLASEKSGYKFIGWYNSKKDGDKIVTTTLLTEGYTIDVEASVAATYVAVYRERTGGEFDVLNLKYAGDTSDPSVPFAHGGESYRYVKVIHEHKNGQTFTKTYDKKADGWSVPDVSEGDKLTITIYTDAFYPEDYFYAWYMEVRDSAGKIVNFEEVGVEKSHVGSKEEVSFTFEYIVKQNDNGITIYSDVYHKEITKDIIYLYQDRYNNTKQYIKSKYTLVDKELITGVPSEETIIKFAPWVEDLYKDTQWIFAEDKFTEDSWTLVATQAPTEYTVRVFTNPVNITPIKGVYDTPVEVYATEIDPNATNNGWWYEDCGTVPGSYDDGDKILAYGTYYGLLIKRNVDIGYYYKPELELNFNVALDAPIYGREQSGVDGTIDKIFVDYHTSIHVPYFNGDELKNGEVITDVYYEGETFVSANSPVTLETLEKFGYKVEYGIITEQVGTFKIGADGTYDDYTSAEADAKKEGFMTATDESLLAKVVGNDLTKGWGKEFGLGGPKLGTSDEYYTVYALTDKDFISNKNRFPFTLIFNNTTANRGRFYNVYGYIAVTYTPEGSTTSVTEYYFSNMETLNFHEAGTNTSDAYNK